MSKKINKKREKKDPDILYAGIKDHKFILEAIMCAYER